MENEEVRKLKRQLRLARRKLKESQNRAIIPAEEASPELSKEVSKAEGVALPKIKRIGGRRWWQVYAGAGGLAIAVFLLIIYAQDPLHTNPLLAMAFIIFAVGGGLLTFMGLKKRDEGIKFVKLGASKALPIHANCLNIYYRKDGGTNKVYPDHIAFEEMIPPDEYDRLKPEERCEGKIKGEIKSKHPQRCLDDGKYYYVHLFDPVNKELVPFSLPDQQYYDPREMANVVTMPATRKVLKPKATWGERLRPVLLVVAIGILGVIFIATSTPPAPPGTSPPPASTARR